MMYIFSTMKTAKSLTLLAILFMFFVGCSDKEKSELEDVKQLPEKSPLLMINSESYYIDDVLRYAHFTLTEMADESLENEAIKAKILDDFIHHQLLTQKAKNENITIDRTQINDVIKNFNSTYGEEDLNLFTSQSILNLEHLKTIIEQQMMIQRYLDSKISSQIQIGKDELKNYYDDSIKTYPKTKLIHLFHIITNTKGNADKARKQLYRRKKFENVAEQYSIGPAKDKGGDLGYVDVDNFPEVFQYAKKMRKGKISKVIKSDYGYHIFKVKNIKSNKTPSFEEISGQLYADLFAQKQDEKTNQLIKELLENANIQVLDNFSLNLSTIDNTSRNYQ